MSISFFFFLLPLRPPRSTLFPYTTLFRSDVRRDPSRGPRSARGWARRFAHPPPLPEPVPAQPRRAAAAVRADSRPRAEHRAARASAAGGLPRAGGKAEQSGGKTIQGGGDRGCDRVRPSEQAPMTVTTITDAELVPKDYASDQEVRWCPGCGDYAIL